MVNNINELKVTTWLWYDCPIAIEAKRQFLNDVIFKHPQASMLLSCLSDIFVLTTSTHTQTETIQWKNILNKHQYKSLEQNKDLILGFVLIKKIKDESVDFVEVMGEIVPNWNIARTIMNHYIDIMGIPLFPRIIDESNAKYWANLIDVVQESEIDDIFDYFGIDPDNVSWGPLYQLCGKCVDSLE
jgi:hypothetical protein